MGFWKKLFSEENQNSAVDEDAYSLEWRNRYLSARKAHLLKKLTKAGRGAPTFEKLPEDLNAKNQALEKQINRLEHMI